MADFQPELLSKVVDRFKALADENRIRLLMRLKAGPCNVATLGQDLAMGQPSVSKHLAVLKQAGLVGCSREGTQMIYRIRDQTIFDLCSLVCDGVRRHLLEEHAALGLGEGAKVEG